jgi:NAD(P)-dependent dehydrogenase (short-subunit alcohol dehydrogenase family)
VFGASSGIGREAALRFARRGAKVVVSARGEEGLTTLVDEIRRAGGDAHAVVADAADFRQVQAVADEAVRRYGRLDTWAHVAGVGLYATFEQTTPEEFAQVVAVNLLGQVHGAKAALPHLWRSGGGTLIHISSVEAQRAMPYHSAYAASKHGVHGFVEALRVELAHADAPIQVTEILPPSINTPFFTKSRTKIGVQPKPLPPVYPPALVADAILHAAEHPAREIVLGGAGKQMLATQRISPRLMDGFLARAGFRLQETREPKSADAPDNLFGPVRGQDRVEGDFSAQAKLEAAAPWLERNQWAVAGAVALGLLAVFASPGRKR